MTYLIYGVLWNNALSMMQDPMSVDDAKARYEHGLEVGIASGLEELAAEPPDDLDFEGEQPAEWWLYTELSRSTRSSLQPDVAIVEFYDFWGTKVADHTFHRQDDGRLFLTEAAEYDYATSTGFVEDNEWTAMTVHHFQPDGTSKVVERRTASDGSTEERSTEHRGGDFRTHWEDVPAWGDWASITRRDRSQPA